MDEASAMKEGYVRCICGEWAVSMHSSCRALLTADEYRRWMTGR